VSAADQPQLDAEIERTRSVLDTVDTFEEAAARGYVLATSSSLGIGTPLGAVVADPRAVHTGQSVDAAL